MSILITGMKMPKNCATCQMLEGDKGDGLCHAASRWLDDDEYWTWYVYPEGDIDDSKPCNCPLIELPPHGRLGDLDALERNLREMADYQHGDRQQGILGCCNTICSAHTIIPPEGGADG